MQLHLILLVLVLFFLLIALLGIVTVAGMMIYSSLISRVPLVPVRTNALKTIVSTLNLTPGAVLYDLGSGDGRVLKAALDNEPHIKAIGLEIGPWPRLVSKILLRPYSHQVEIRNQNFFKANFSDATHIYLYLYPSLLKELMPLFEEQLSPGTRIVTCDFALPEKTPVEILPVPKSKTLSKTLYVYTWQ